MKKNNYEHALKKKPCCAVMLMHVRHFVGHYRSSVVTQERYVVHYGCSCALG